jgi:hypothetical protein
MAKTIYVSDFDDTLVTTKGAIRLTSADGTQSSLTPAEYAVYDKKAGDEFDFSDFADVIDPQPIQKNFKVLQRAVASPKVDKVVILTARSKPEPIARFLKSMGIESGLSIVALGDGDPQKKKDYLKRQLEAGFTRMAFADDSPKNVAVAKELRDEFPQAAIVVRQAHPPEEKHPTQENPRSPIDRAARVKNPITGNEILQITALSYPPDHPAYIAARKQINGG